MNASLQITEAVSITEKSFVFDQGAALSLISTNIQANIRYLEAVVPSDTVINIDSSKMQSTGILFILF